MKIAPLKFFKSRLLACDSRLSLINTSAVTVKRFLWTQWKDNNIHQLPYIRRRVIYQSQHFTQLPPSNDIPLLSIEELLIPDRARHNGNQFDQAPYWQ